MDNLKKLARVTALMVFSFSNIEATNIPNRAIHDERFGTKMHPFSDQKEMDYYLHNTWDSKLTKRENQKKVVDDFVDNCCDFSLKITQKSNDYCIGELATSRKILFSNKLVKELSLPLNTIVSPDAFPISSSDKYKDQFIRIFSKMAESSVGCKLFRIITAKVAVNGWPKLPFIPIDGEKIKEMGLIAIQEAANVGYWFGSDMQGDSWNKLMYFSPEVFSTTDYACVAKYEGNELRLMDEVLPLDVSMFHELLHFLHLDSREKSQISSAIKKRSDIRITPYLSKKYDEYVSVNKWLYRNDEEFRTMFGLTEQGIDPLNEAAYFVQTRKAIRFHHGDKSYKDLKETLDPRMIDTELYFYYLLSDSALKFPKFGTGQYKCSDYDSVTGRKISEKN
ncbi:MAG: hypothetical protein J6T29_00600 [Alphaproteobacteria bacterium]|nr:hypothetical protein [Alphaproteobacteria bacterium]